MTHPLPVLLEASALLDSGMHRDAVADRLGVPRATVRTWSRGRWPARAGRAVRDGPACPRCLELPHDLDALPAGEYAQLLGLYLGDGCIAPLRASYQLRINMDSRYPRIIDEAAEAVRAVVPGGTVGVYPVRGEQSVNVTSCSPAWPCLLPQHGAGKKHERAIELEEWQQRLVAAEPGRFLRGLIHSDGWRGENRVRVKGRDYSYPRYQFSNRSDDIRRLFTDACDLLEIAWRPWGRWHVSVARRDAVARLDRFVGPKG